MPISSMVRRALTLPTPGSDSSTARTLVLPTISSSSACSSSSASDSEPIFSRSLSSARCPAGDGGLLEGGLPLLGRQSGREHHGAEP